MECACASFKQKRYLTSALPCNFQLAYWNGLTQEQQQQLLDGMSSEERKMTEAFVSGKPTMTISKESLDAWNAMSKADQDAQMAIMTPDQQQAIRAAVSGAQKTVDLSQEVK